MKGGRSDEHSRSRTFHSRRSNFATGQEVAFRFTPNVSSVGQAILAGTAVCAIGGMLPAIRAARLSPRQAMRA